MNKNQLSNNITFRAVSFEDRNLVYILSKNMKNSIGPILFSAPSINYIEDITASFGYIPGAFEDKKLIAFASYICPKQAKTNLTQYHKL